MKVTKKMKNKIIWIIIADDWELRGNGTGNVIELQYNNALKLMELCETFRLNMTFNVEVMQQLAFEKYSKNFKEIKKYQEYWKRTIEIMIEKGFDIQLHIHPQWFNANYNGEYWNLDNRWNIADYSEEKIDFFIRSSLDYLRRHFNGINPISFRGGAWGVYPSKTLFTLLEKYGIKFDISMANGLFSCSKNINIDYRNLESPYLPYYPDYEDVRKVSKKKTKIIEIPTQSFARDWKFKVKKGLLRLPSIYKKENIGRKISNTVKSEKINTNNKKNRKKDYIIMDIANLDIFAMKIGFDIIIKRAINSNNSDQCIIPLVIESHTKDLNNYQIENIKKAFEYLFNKYENIIEFKTMSDIYRNIKLIKPINK
jgi:hypothetical protein